MSMQTRPCDELLCSSPANPPRGAIAINRRGWSAEDFKGAAIAVGAFENDEEARQFASAARAHGVPVNVDRQAGVLRFLVRRHRQSFAAGDRNIDRRCCPGVSRRRSAPSSKRCCRTGLPAWAAAAARWRSAVKASGLVIFRTPQVLAIVHRAGRLQSGPRTGSDRFRALHCRGDGASGQRSKMDR